MRVSSKIFGSIQSVDSRRARRQLLASCLSASAENRGRDPPFEARPGPEFDLRPRLRASKVEGSSQLLPGRSQAPPGSDEVLWLDHLELGRNWPPPRRHAASLDPL